ncbi:MAG: LytTR family DNA-binding domain-containing protein [Eubacterium sp.]|nr:LytTR family DNA-binding domain-containing protein [Eubacterium sp.]
MLIVLCEDNREDREAAAVLIRQCAETLFADWQLECCASAQEYQEKFSDQSVDIAFVDIYFGDDSGIALAKGIRDKNPRAGIVFLTVSNEFAAESYQVKALDYILKPARADEIERAFKRCLQVQAGKSKVIDIKKGHDIIRLQEELICKIEADGNYLSIYTEKGEIRIRKRFKDIAGQLSGNMIMLRRGVIVNMGYIKMIKNNVCWLKSGEEIPLSRKNAREIRESYYNYQFDSVREKGCE